MKIDWLAFKSATSQKWKTIRIRKWGLNWKVKTLHSLTRMKMIIQHHHYQPSPLRIQRLHSNYHNILWRNKHGLHILKTKLFHSFNFLQCNQQQSQRWARPILRDKSEIIQCEASESFASNFLSVVSLTTAWAEDGKQNKLTNCVRL